MHRKEIEESWRRGADGAHINGSVKGRKEEDCMCVCVSMRMCIILCLCVYSKCTVCMCVYRYYLIIPPCCSQSDLLIIQTYVCSIRRYVCVW